MFEVITKDSLENLCSFLTEHNVPNVNWKELNDNPFLNLVVYKENNQIVGYLNYSIMYDKAELNYIYVVSDYRGRKIGSKLMEYLLSKCKFCENITLEVRKDNVPAINLYKKYDFFKCAIRKRYYQGIDGILMMRKRGE